MKKKIGKINNKPVVIGNSNKFTKNEIPLKSLIKTPKEEFDLSYDNIQQKCYFLKVSKHTYIMNNNISVNQLFGEELLSKIQYLNYGKYNFIAPSDLARPYYLLGFRYNVGTSYRGEELPLYKVPDEILEYFIEVPFNRFYDKNTNFFCYTSNKDFKNGKELYKRFTKLNLVEGEWFSLDGYMFTIPDAAADDGGVISKVRKVGSEFEYESIRNFQLEGINTLRQDGSILYFYQKG